MTTPAIEVAGLVKAYGDHAVLDGLDLTVDGGIYALLGANGAGKTTLITILTTVGRADAGSVTIGGRPAADVAAIRRLISVTGQSTAVDDLLTARENLELIGELLGLGARKTRARADELLEAFDLTASARKLASKLSGGTRRRVDLAMSLVVQPAVLFLDEPTTGLDPVSRRRLWDDIRRLADTGTTVFLTTQYLEEAEALADRIGVLAGGRLVAEGTAAELVETVGGSEIVLSTADGQQVRTLTSDGTAAGLAAALADLPADQRSLQVSTRMPTLEEAFTALSATDSRTREDQAA